MDRISYAFGRDYLKSWTIKDALREIFQNYIDYGKYDIQTNIYENTNNILVHIKNDYIPEKLEFLRLGNTSKDGGGKIGHHGEGLKAAFLIFEREGLHFRVFTDKYALNPSFDNRIIGETLSINYEPNNTHRDLGFVTEFDCPKDIYEEFVNSLITKNDILYDNRYYGKLLKPERGKGNIYSGGIFVCNIKNLNHSYDINPKHLQLDRDRRVPSDWDINYSTSKILESYKLSQVEPVHYYSNYNARDYSYNSSLTDKDLEVIEAVNIDNKVQYYDTHHKEVINNSAVTEVLKKHPKFKKNIGLNRREKFNRAKIANGRKSAISLLKLFKDKYCNVNEDMSIDIDVIIDKINIKNNGRKPSK